ncbi:hypothetical protein QT995_18130 [Microcoleus sp. S36b_A3]
MLFSSYKTISTVAKAFPIKYQRDRFIVETELAVSAIFCNELGLDF